LVLTKLVENNKTKAEVYWPEQEGETKLYGNISVTFQKLFNTPIPTTIRSFRLKHNIDGKSREVIQVHYMDWPDFGVPSKTKPIRDLAVLVDQFKNRGATRGLNGPAIFHCSAGIGRTGCFVAIHITLQKLMHGGSCSIFYTVNRLRLQREGMVQTFQQYEFIYKTVKEAMEQMYLLTPEQLYSQLLGASVPAEAKKVRFSVPVQQTPETTSISRNNLSGSVSTDLSLPSVAYINTSEVSSSPNNNSNTPIYLSLSSDRIVNSLQNLTLVDKTTTLSADIRQSGKNIKLTPQQSVTSASSL